jgi:hypothetical protein
MSRVRSRLAVLTLMLLMQQTLALALTGVLACCEPAAASTASRMECCEKAGDGHMCPIANRSASDRGCRMKKGCSTDGAAVLAGAGFVYSAPLVGRFSIVPPVVHRHTWRLVVDEAPLASTPPPTPPPKA